MNGRISAFLAGVIVVLLSCKQDQKQNQDKVSHTRIEEPIRKNVFRQLPSSKTGITFSNTIKEDVSTLENVFDFDYFYNGAGVGVADLDNDGLQDLFFAGNQVPNALYRNKGNLTFEDVTATAGINQGKQWANGVTFADVNDDGLLDIYISQGGPRREADRKNVLLINEGDMRFRESAATYNIADTGISTQSVFFDYDRDGDLDLVVSNENESYGYAPQPFMERMKNDAILQKSSVHLYRNDGGRFTKVTKEAGLLQPAFGLGVTVSDINNDGWLDVYIANDYYIPDAMYINNQDGTFTDRIKEYTSQVSFYGMGVDIADVNNDKLQDIFVLDMAASDHVRSKTLMASMNLDRFSLLVDSLAFQYQYMFNSLQLNLGNNQYGNVVQQAKMAKTDWSWAGLLVDLDNDADRDVYVTNGYRKYALDNDLQNQVREAQRAFNGRVPLEVKQRLYDAIPTEKLSNILFQNTGDLHFEKGGYQWGVAVPSYSNGGAYADLDNDGDLELIVNNIDDEALIFENTSASVRNYLRIKTEGKLSESFAKIEITHNGTTQVAEAKRTVGYLSSVEGLTHFGLGETAVVDEVRVVWPSGKEEKRKAVAANQLLVFKESEALAGISFTFGADEGRGGYAFARAAPIPNLSYQHNENPFNDFNKEILLPQQQSRQGPFMSKGDANGDGLDDILITGASGQQRVLYIQTKEGYTTTILSKEDALQEDMESLFIDVDNDNDQDIIVLSGGTEFETGSSLHQNSLYINDGKGTFTYVPLEGGFMNSKSVAALDYDGDGDLDLVIGNRIQPQQYPLYQSSQLLENREGKFIDVTVDRALGLANVGMVNKVIATDFNGDGAQDFITVGEWGSPHFFQNNTGIFKDVTASFGLEGLKGWWFTIQEVDINNDNRPDYVLGNIGDNIKYKASEKEPFKVFASDFDNTGSLDLVLSTTYKGTYVPARGKECSTQQMPFISEKFETYNAFANASLSDIYGDKLADSYKAEVTTFSSTVLLNTRNGFTIGKLPALAQIQPIMSLETIDVNGDGYDDLIAAGAIYESEVETPRYDTGRGLVLLSDQKGNFKAISPHESKLYLEGNVKHILTVKHKGLAKQLLLSGVNDASLEVFELTR